MGRVRRVRPRAAVLRKKGRPDLMDVVAHPPVGCDVKVRVLRTEVNEDPEPLWVPLALTGQGVGGTRMPGAAALGLDLDRDAARVGPIAGQDVDAGHVAGECDCVAAA